MIRHFLVMIGLISWLTTASAQIASTDLLLKDNVLGNASSVEVYSFIVEQLMREPSYTSAEIEKLILEERSIKENNERQIKQKNRASLLKSHLGQMYDAGEIKHFLDLLLRCGTFHTITLYQKDGVGLATSHAEEMNALDEKSLRLRPEGLQLGILNKELTTNPQDYHLKGKNGKTYLESVRSIYLVHSEQSSKIGYVSSKKRHPLDQRIGYVSYIIDITKAPYFVTD